MSTRPIVTSQPDVACYVCERRLLRGEHPEIFLVDGGPQTVCELCAPRAAHQGWPRGEQGQVLPQPVVSSRRGGGLFARLRGPARPVADRPSAAERNTRARHGAAGALAAGEPIGGEGESDTDASGAAAGVEGAPQPGAREWALEAFNRSEYPRRIASLSRSLGVPDVSVLLDDDLPIVTIVVAWELCWYRYRVDSDEPQPEVRMIAEGRTLEELDRSERVCNGLADERGGLWLIAAAV